MKLLNNLSLIIPSKNDAVRIYENIEFIIKYLHENIDEFEIIIVSNGSSKESVLKIDKLSSKYSFIRHCVLKESGKGIAVKEGLLKSKYNNILFTDADCSVNILEFDNFVENQELISGFVVGNRKNHNSKNLNSPLLRKISGYLYLKLLINLFNLDIEDTQCGFKAINKLIFKDCVKFTTKGYSFDLELFLLARESNVKVRQIPVEYVHNSNSKILIFSDTLKMIRETFSIYSLKK